MIQRLAAPIDPVRLTRLAAVHAAAFEPEARGWAADDIASFARRGALYADEPDRAFALFSKAADEAELLTLAVHPDHRRRGLARALLAASIDDLAGSGMAWIFLEVAADNRAAIALYETLGFQISGERPAYYRRSDGRRVDAILMRRCL